MKKIMLLFILLLISLPLTAQENSNLTVNTGTDIVSRYVWRGLDFGNAAALQPSLSVAYKGLEVGSWGSFAFDQDASANDEVDLWMAYTIPVGSGSVTAMVFDYYYPNAGLKYFDFDGDGDGAHTLEASLAYSPAEKCPFTILGAVNVHNDSDNSLYFELGYNLNINNQPVTFFLGAAKGESAWYGLTDDGFALTNAGVSFSKAIPISEKFSLPINTAFIINPEMEKAYLVFKVSL